MEVFKFKDYRHFIQHQLNAGKNKRGAMSRLSEALNVKSSFLTQVLNGSKKLSQEQGYFLSKYYRLSEREGQYVQELINLDRAGDPDYKSVILRRLESYNGPAQATELLARHQPIFYSSWIYSAIQLLTGIEGFQTTERIAQRLGLSEKVVQHALDNLAEAELCRTDGKNYYPGVQKTTLSEDSIFNSRHKTNWRMKALEYVAKPKDKDLFFTGVLRVDQAGYAQIQKLLQELVQKVNQTVDQSKDETLVCVNLDSFKI